MLLRCASVGLVSEALNEVQHRPNGGWAHAVRFWSTVLDKAPAQQLHIDIAQPFPCFTRFASLCLVCCRCAAALLHVCVWARGCGAGAWFTPTGGERSGPSSCGEARSRFGCWLQSALGLLFLVLAGVWGAAMAMLVLF